MQRAENWLLRNTSKLQQLTVQKIRPQLREYNIIGTRSDALPKFVVFQNFVSIFTD